MKRTLSRLSAILLALSIALSFFAGCVHRRADDIIVLFTNDVHCGVDDKIGYAGLAAYRDYCKSLTPHVTLADCGDAIQGALIGTVSDGEYIVDIMNHVGYDLAVLGNHEFDFGMDQISKLMKKSNADYLGCNVTYQGKGTNALEGLAPYRIIDYAGTSVAYIGVSTPHTLTSATPTYFMENGEFVYQFNLGGVREFYDGVQGYVDQCRKKGADYVILLTHLGDTEDQSPYSSLDLIQNTEGVDAVLDGHSHSAIPCRVVKNRTGGTVLLSSTGTKLDNIGQLTISANGTISTTLITETEFIDGETEAFVKGIQGQYEAEMSEVIAQNKQLLTGYTPEGIRLVRNRETTIGNFCADAYRAVTGADVAVVNGGGVRADLKAGDITYADLIAVHPFGNTLCMIEISGQELLDALEVCYCNVKNVYEENGQAAGENGEFMQISGMKLTVDTSIPTSVVFDGNGMLQSIGDARRVKEVSILNDEGTYVPLDVNATYTLASHNYYLKNNGGNHTLFDDNTLLINESMSDYEVLITYLTDDLGGVLDERYQSTEGRITIR